MAPPRSKKTRAKTNRAVNARTGAKEPLRTKSDGAKAKRATRSPRTPRARVAGAAPWDGDLEALVARMRSTVDALRAVGCTVSARFEKPAAAAASKALAAAFEGIVPPSLAAIFSRFDGFDVQWERDDVAVTCTWMGARDVVSAWRAEQKLVASLASEDGGDPGLAARRTIVPLIAQYDGGLVGLDVARAARGEMPVVFLDRLADASKVIASSAGHLLEALVHGAFTHPGIPDVAHRKALPIAKALARRR